MRGSYIAYCMHLYMFTAILTYGVLLGNFQTTSSRIFTLRWRVYALTYAAAAVAVKNFGSGSLIIFANTHLLNLTDMFYQYSVARKTNLHNIVDL
jgi:hypothetical protein